MKPLSQIVLFILRCVNFLLEAIDWDADVPAPHVDSLGKVCSMKLKGPSLNSIFRTMLGEKDYRAVDMIFSIIGADVNYATLFRNDAITTTVHLKYSKMESKLVAQTVAKSSLWQNLKSCAEMIVRLRTML